MTFKEHILQGIPKKLPVKKALDKTLSRAPRRKQILSVDEKKLAIRNALRYFPKSWHKELAHEFLKELETYGRIYMYRFIPDYPIYARPIKEYPSNTPQAAAIMLMIQNNLDPAVAQHPYELITYGGNGAVFQNWAQYLLTMQYLANMSQKQTLHIYSGHPMGQMTAGSYMYIGPQGIVHGTTITVMNAFRKVLKTSETPAGKVFLTSGLGGMSGAQPKAGNIAGCITVCAEINPKAAQKRHQQGWVDEIIDNITTLVARIRSAITHREIVSIAYQGNVVDVWEQFYEENIHITLGSDQTSLHNPWSGGYYPIGLSYEQANEMITNHPEAFKIKVKESLKRHAIAINKHTAIGTYFFDYGNAFLLEASRAGADVMATNGIDFRYPSYVQDILGPMCFDYGFGPFRWVCTSGSTNDLDSSDKIALRVMKSIKSGAPTEIQQQMQDNITWIEEAKQNQLVVGSQARILYADAEGRIKIAQAFNKAIKNGEITAPIVLGRDHHDVSGTDSPYRETSNIYDGSKFTADMAIQNVIGDSFRGATWVSIHNGGGVGWGEVINGGFGLVLDGSETASKKLQQILFYDVNNGISRRSWSRNKEALFAIKREMRRTPELQITLPELVDDVILKDIL